MKSNLPDGFREPGGIPIDVQRELDRAAPRLGVFAGHVHWLGVTGSTNDVAQSVAGAGGSEGTVVVAEAQTAGRGRMGRVWFSPPGAGLYVSIILKPTSDQLLTLAAGVAIAEGVRVATGLPVEIKWPNDVMIGRRKLAGILTEAAAQGGAVQYVVLGFGVNLQPAAYPAEIRDRATSIEAETSRPADRALILAEVLAALAARYAQLRAGRFDAILDAWRRLAPSLPASVVEWDSAGGVIRGRAEDIDETGALVVRVGGKVERLIAGEIRWL